MRRLLYIICSIVLMFMLTICSLPVTAYAEEIRKIEATNDETQELSLGEAGGYLVGSLKTTKRLYADRKFSMPTGHGFAAENGNNLYDSLRGLNTKVIGENNAKNGADRVINTNDTSILIQDKYYSTAKRSVNSAFDTDGFYKYVDADDMPIQLEVPSDQYEEAVLKMKECIKEGKVRNITDEAESENIIRQGKLSYKQAVNLTKAGNIDSLKYDATTGVISAAYATGISFAINFALATINGNDFETALSNSLGDSLKTGAVVGLTHILASQLTKTSLNNLYVPAGNAIAKVLGKDICAILVESAGENVTKATAINKAAKLIAKEVHVQVVLLIVLTVPDIIDLFSGKISPEQLLANVTVTASGLAGTALGAAGGAAIGSFFPGPGNVIGGIVGGVIGGSGASIGTGMIIDNFTESDAEKMCKILQEEFEKLSNDYFVTKDEADEIVEKLQSKLDGNTIKDMYSSKDRNKFANNLLTNLFEEQVSERKISIPSDEEVRIRTKELVRDVAFIR